MKGINRLSVIRHKSKINKNWIHTDLFRILHKEDIWIAAYENLKNNKRTVTPVGKKDILDDSSLLRLLNLRDQVVKQKYYFKSVNEIENSKPDCSKISSRLSITNDKIVQEVIRMILEAIYEPCFSKTSFGFRQKVETHDTLKYIKAKFRSVDWVIEGDTTKPYPTIHSKKLCEILSEKINDIRFLNLIQKVLKSGILWKEQFSRSNLGILQGSILSSIIIDIYYNALDKWVHKKIFFNNIKYVRYADHWIIGINDDPKLVQQLKKEVSIFLKERLKQLTDSTKVTITNLHAGKVKFLGYDIYRSRQRKISSYKALRFDIPLDSILLWMKKKGYIKNLSNNSHRAISKVNYTTLDDIVIIKHFSNIWKVLKNYYSESSNFYKLQYIHCLLNMSCYLTLTHRHNSTLKKTFKKYKNYKFF